VPGLGCVGVASRELLDRLAIPKPWRGTVEASLSLIDDLDAEIDLVTPAVAPVIDSITPGRASLRPDALDEVAQTIGIRGRRQLLPDRRRRRGRRLARS
jgi:hypothetical protein